jgi:Protein of unknown function (DUF1364)
VSKLRDAARGEDCKVRVPGICNFRTETTVLAHYRMSGICGTGMKPIDLIGADACSDCHDAIDGRTKTAYTREQLDLMHAEGVFRTIANRFKRGLIKG